MDEEARAQSMKAIKQQKSEAYRLWERKDVLCEIRKLIKTKEAKHYKGCPYQRFVLLIYTDEPELSDTVMSHFLEGGAFRTRVFTDVVVGLSYHPASGTYPTFRLNLIHQRS